MPAPISQNTHAADVALALVSCPPDRAEALARALVEHGVAACVNIVPAVRSIYRWQGAVSDDTEALLLIGHAPYLDWVLGSCAA